PPSSISTTRVRAPASREFSTSSLTTAAGRRMTSPAAIWAATWGDRIRMARGLFTSCLGPVTGLSFPLEEGCDPVLLYPPRRPSRRPSSGLRGIFYEFRVLSLEFY